MKSLNEIKDLVESNQSEQAIMAAQLDDCSKAVALDLAGHKEKAQEIVSALDPSEKEKGLENFYETEVEHLFLSENLETVQKLLKDNRQELAASMVEQVKNSMDEKEYSQKVSDMIGIIETPVVFNLKDQSYSLENDDAAKMFDFYGLKISVDTQDEGLAYLIEEFSGTSEKVEAVAKLVSGQFKICLEDETSENESIKKIATKKLMGFLESAKDMFKDSKLAGKIGDYAMASAVVAVMAASGVSYVKMMKDVNSTHFHNNVKSLVDGHVEVQGNLLE